MSKLKVFLLCNNDLTTNIIFSPLFTVAELEIVGIGVTLTLNKNKGGLQGALEVLKKTDFRYWLFLVFTNGFYAVNRLLAVFSSDTYYPISKHSTDLARKRDIPVYHSENFNSDSFLKILRESQVDLLLIRVNQILSAELLQIPKKSTWCVHSSLLPAYKGIAGEFHALNNQEQILGSSIFEVTPILDAGRILFQTKFGADKKRSLFAHIVQNNRNAALLLKEKVLEFSRGNLEIQNLNDQKKSYFSWPKPHQVDQFLKHYRFITFLEALSFALKSLFFK